MQNLYCQLLTPHIPVTYTLTAHNCCHTHMSTNTQNCFPSQSALTAHPSLPVPLVQDLPPRGSESPCLIDRPCQDRHVYFPFHFLQSDNWIAEGTLDTSSLGSRCTILAQGRVTVSLGMAIYLQIEDCVSWTGTRHSLGELC